MKKTLLAFSLFLIGTFLLANPISLQQANQVAKNTLIESDLNLGISRSSKDINLKLSPLSNEQIYIFNNSNNNGFAIISNSDAAFPILAFSSDKEFPTEDVPPAVQQFLDSYKTQIIEIEKNNLPITTDIANIWQKYSNPNFTPERDRDVVEPLVKSLWNQCKYYNTLCPEDSDGVDGHVPVGCVATAMSQIMHYHKYPTQGNGFHSYYSDYGYHEANYGETTYNWENIPNYLTDYNDDLALLGFHCGVSVNMNYGTHGSGAWTSDVAYALEEYFDYNSDIQHYYREDFSDSDWENMLKTNLNDGLPLEYSGSSDTSGHAFVCDGYQGENHFHFNWGWDGLFNGFYYLNNLNPRTSTFNDWQTAIFNIYPNHEPEINFVASHVNVNVGSPISFTDLSLYTPNEWAWNFESAEIETSTEQNPNGIIYNSAGDYDVTLTATNRFGSSSLTLENYIHVENNFAPIAAFSLSDSIIGSDQNIFITDSSLNSPTSWNWSFLSNGNASSVEYLNSTDQFSQNPEVSFPIPKPYNVKLEVENDFGSDELTQGTIYVGGLPIPFFEDFEIPLQLDAWTVESEDDYISWDGIYFAGGNEPGAKAIGINFNAYNNIGEVDRLISPLLNFSNKTEITLSFMHAYANKPYPKDDQLEILISSDAGETWETIATLSDVLDENFATHEPMDSRFVPAEESDWANVYSFDLSAYSDMPDIKICFQATNDNGNCLYLDKINISATELTDLEPNEYEAENFTLNSYPNPYYLSANNNATISYSLPKNTNVDISVYNIKGQKVKTLLIDNLSSGRHQITWNGRDENNKIVSSGVYFFKLETTNSIQTTKLLIIK